MQRSSAVNAYPCVKVKKPLLKCGKDNASDLVLYVSFPPPPSFASGTFSFPFLEPMEV